MAEEGRFLALNQEFTGFLPVVLVVKCQLLLAVNCMAEWERYVLWLIRFIFDKYNFPSKY